MNHETVETITKKHHSTSTISNNWNDIISIRKKKKNNKTVFINEYEKISK